MITTNSTSMGRPTIVSPLIEKTLTKGQKDQSQHIVFQGVLDKINGTNNDSLTVLDEAILFNQRRMSKTGLRDDKRQRFLARANDLTLIKQYFEHHQALSFKGLIGWGRGCVQTSIFSNQNVSAVDGFLYFDAQGNCHYQRLGSCLEYFFGVTIEFK